MDLSRRLLFEFLEVLVAAAGAMPEEEWIRLEIVLHAIWMERWRDSMSRS